MTSTEKLLKKPIIKLLVTHVAQDILKLLGSRGSGDLLVSASQVAGLHRHSHMHVTYDICMANKLNFIQIINPKHLANDSKDRFSLSVLK